MPNPLSAIVFDFDGTLADSMLIVLPVYNRIAVRMALPQITVADIPALRRLGPMKAIEAYSVPLWKVPLLLTQVRRELEAAGQVPPLFSGLREVLTAPRLRSVSSMILSSNSKANILQFLEHYPLQTFDHIDCGASLFGKARRLRRLLQVRHLVPATVAYVGDEVRDIEAAKEVGAMSIAVSWGYAEKEALAQSAPDFLVDTPAALGELFESLLGK